MATLGFKALHHGVERMPDQAFEKIPYVGRRYFKEKDRSSRDRKDSDSDSESDSSSDRDRRSRRSRRSHRRSAPQGDRRGDHDRGYDSDQGPKPYTGTPYFPPPPRISVNQPDGGKNDQQGPYLPRPYNPADYGARPGSRDDYFAGHPQEQAPFVAPAAQAPPSQQQSQRPPSQSGAASDSADPNRHSSVADRYRPANYDARSQQGRGSPAPGYPSALTVRHPSQDYNEYSPPAYDYDSDSDADRRQSRRHRSKSRGSQRSRSRAGSAASKVKDGFEKHKKDIGAGALGAIAGGILGNVLGGGNKRKNKSNLTGMVIGAALGGLGAAALEKRHEKNKAKRMGEHDGYESY